MPQASCSYSSDARPEMVSTINSAGWLVRLRALRTSSGWVTQLVEVSLCTTSTALILCARSAASLASICSTSAPRRQSVGRNSTSSLNFSAMPRHSTANWPVSAISTLSPGDSVLTIAASQAPDARRGIDDDRLFGAEDALAAGQHGITEFGEFGAAMIQGRHVHGPQHPVGHVGRSWNLKKMPSSVQGHLGVLPGSLRFGRALEYHYLAGLSPARRVPSMRK